MSSSDRFVELRAPSRQWRWWHWTLMVGVAGLFIGGGGAFYLFWSFSQDLPDLQVIHDHHPSLVTTVYADNREVIGQFYIERRFLTPLAEIPESLTQAVISVEDARFYDHPGLDIIGIFRAAWTNFRRGGKVEGASTITQQLARSLFLSPERTYARKIRELLLAFQIEDQLTKDQILEMYLNQIYFGHGAYGVRAAAQTFFSKPLAALELEESAILAGLPKSPNNYSPFRFPERAKRRQEHVLARMSEAGFITAAERQEAEEAELEFHRPESKKIAPYFLENVRQHLVGQYGESMVYKGGLEVFTTLNVDMQRAAERAVEQGLKALDKRQGWRGPLKTLTKEELADLLANAQDSSGDPPEEGEVAEGVVTKVERNFAEVLVRSTTGRLDVQDMEWAKTRLKGPSPSKDAVKLTSLKGVLKQGHVIEVSIKQVDGDQVQWQLDQTPRVEGGFVTIDPRNGAVRAMVGGYDFQRSEYNRATSARRQPGSAFKPIIYTAAITKGLGPGSLVLDAPVVYEEAETGKIWKPENYEKRFYGVISVRDALIHSRNLATVRLLDRVGFKPVAKVAHALGIQSPLNFDLSLALGSSSITLMELTSAYSVFANQGIWNKPYTITTVQDADGNILEQVLPEPQEALTRESAYLITNMLYDVVQRGTGRRAKVITRPVAGKTGTTNDYTDGWFIGFTPNIAAGVWVGFDDRQTLGDRESGAHSALPIWIAFMKDALKQLPVMPFEIPDGIEYVRIDPETGLLPSEQSTKATVEIFARGTEPTETSPQHLDPTEFYKLDRPYDLISTERVERSQASSPF